MNKYLTSGIIGILVGYLSTLTFFIHSWLALIPWGIIGVLVGFLGNERRQKVWLGAAYGFGLTVAFLLGGFRGDPSQWPKFILLSAALGILGACCGIVLSYLSSVFKKPV